jgi:uroporphyrinogen-III synthase
MSPAVVLLSSPESLEEEAGRLSATGVEVRRICALRFARRPFREWGLGLPGGAAYRVLLVTSPRAVEFGLAPYLRLRGPSDAIVWAVGPRTAEAVHRALGGAARLPRGVGAEALVDALGGPPGQRILYFRSDLAGAGLTGELRRRGHRVREVVAYRARPAGPLRPRERRALEGSRVWIATSPSALRFARAQLGRTAWATAAGSTSLLVLGERSAAAARRLGFRRVIVASPGRPQRFTRRVLDEVRRAA